MHVSDVPEQSSLVMQSIVIGIWLQFRNNSALLSIKCYSLSNTGKILYLTYRASEYFYFRKSVIELCIDRMSGNVYIIRVT